MRPVEVELGLSDGQRTRIASGEVREGMDVIVGGSLVASPSGPEARLPGLGTSNAAIESFLLIQKATTLVLQGRNGTPYPSQFQAANVRDAWVVSNQSSQQAYTAAQRHRKNTREINLIG